MVFGWTDNCKRFHCNGVIHKIKGLAVVCQDPSASDVSWSAMLTRQWVVELPLKQLNCWLKMFFWISCVTHSATKPSQAQWICHWWGQDLGPFWTESCLMGISHGSTVGSGIAGKHVVTDKLGIYSIGNGKSGGLSRACQLWWRLSFSSWSEMYFDGTMWYTCFLLTVKNVAYKS